MLWIWLFYYHKCLYISFQINRSDIFQEVEMIFEVHNLGNLLSETKSYEIKDYWKHFYNQIILDLFYLHNKWWAIIQCIYGSAVTNVHLISTLKFNVFILQTQAEWYIASYWNWFNQNLLELKFFPLQFLSSFFSFSVSSLLLDVLLLSLLSLELPCLSLAI